MAMTEKKGGRPTGICIAKDIEPLVKLISGVKGIPVSRLVNDALREYIINHHEQLQEEVQRAVSDFSTFPELKPQANP